MRRAAVIGASFILCKPFDRDVGLLPAPEAPPQGEAFTGMFQEAAPRADGSFKGNWRCEPGFQAYTAQGASMALSRFAARVRRNWGLEVTVMSPAIPAVAHKSFFSLGWLLDS